MPLRCHLMPRRCLIVLPGANLTILRELHYPGKITPKRDIIHAPICSIYVENHI